MTKPNYPKASTIPAVFKREQRGITWATDTIEIVLQNLTVAVKDIPEGDEFSDVRRAAYRALARIREARHALTVAHDATAEAKLVAQRSTPVLLTNRRLIERYGGPHGENGASQVRSARKERERREAEWGDYERRMREQQRQEFLGGKDRRGEGMREDLD
jgi:hypothetical protein